MVAESSEFQLTLSRAHIERIFSNSKYAKNAGHFKSKAGKRDDAKKKRAFTPESATVDTYEITLLKIEVMGWKTKKASGSGDAMQLEHMKERMHR